MILRNLEPGFVDDGFSQARRQELSELFGNHRMTEEITLTLAAILLLQKVGLLSCFHTFGDNTMMKAFANVNHRSDYGGGSSIDGKLPVADSPDCRTCPGLLSVKVPARRTSPQRLVESNSR